MTSALSFFVEIHGPPSHLSGKGSTCNAGDSESVPGSERFLDKEVATHSSILSWEIPWTEEAGGLQSIGVTEPNTTENLQWLDSGIFITVFLSHQES